MSVQHRSVMVQSVCFSDNRETVCCYHCKNGYLEFGLGDLSLLCVTETFESLLTIVIELFDLCVVLVQMSADIDNTRLYSYNML